MWSAEVHTPESPWPIRTLHNDSSAAAQASVIKKTVILWILGNAPIAQTMAALMLYPMPFKGCKDTIVLWNTCKMDRKILWV